MTTTMETPCYYYYVHLQLPTYYQNYPKTSGDKSSNKT